MMRTDSTRNASTPRRRAGLGVAVVAGLALAALPVLAGPQGAQGTHAAWDIDSPGQPTSLEMWVATEMIRMDVGDQASVIMSGGDMTMVMHQQRQYMVFTEEMMERMAGMMGGMMQGQQEPDVDMSTPPTFTRTGNTKTVGAWNAYEVLVEHPDQDGEVHMWFSEDIDVDVLAFATQVAEAMQSFNNPMMQRMNQGQGINLGMLGAMREGLVDLELPDGFPVQIISQDDGQTTTMTLTAVDQGPQDPANFQPPADYQRMEMPFIR